jgi:hypothetical protein
VKTVQQILRELARPEVVEFAVVSDRLPCFKVGDKYQPVDDVPRTTEAILEMLRAVGGAEHVADIEKQPAHWSTRVDGVGSVGVQAVMRQGRLQARFAVTVRSTDSKPLPVVAPEPASPAAPAPTRAPAPAPTRAPAP